MSPSLNQSRLTRADDVPTLSDIRTRTEKIFGVRPCLWQLKVVEGLLKGGKDVLCIAGTGMGKTLTFWMPLLFRTGGIQIVVTPLNLLGKQNAASLAAVGIHGIAINSETATPVNFQHIRAFQYRAIVVSPEQIMKAGSEFEKLLKDPIFISRIVSIIIDEAHCLTEWGEFRPEYRELGRLRYILPSSIPLLITSATLTKTALADTTHLLHTRTDDMLVVRRSSDRPNIKISIRKIKYALNTHADLAFLIPENLKVGDPPPPKFLVFFDDISDSINAALSLRRRLPRELRNKVKWFNADMSTTYKDAELENLVTGENWGLCTTSSFGMGMDVSDISVVVQWRATCTLPALWQRFGHAARNKDLTGMAVLFAEKDHFDDEQAMKAARKAKKASTRKRTVKDADLPTTLRPVKRTAQSSCSEFNVTDSPSAATTASGVSGGAMAARLEAESSSDEESINGDDRIEGMQDVTNLSDSAGLGVADLREAMSKSRLLSSGALFSSKRQKKKLDVGMDFLINAGTRAGVMCRRKVFDVCFDNATAESDHRECDANMVNGCTRCHVTLPTICCDLHNPEEFSFSIPPVSKPPSMAQRSRLPKSIKDKNDYALEDALQGWREVKTSAVYGWACLNDHGPSLVMPNSVLDRIVECAHHQKIRTVQDLKKETSWTDSEQFGQEVISVIQQHAAQRPSLLVSTPLRSNPSLTGSTNANRDAPTTSSPLPCMPSPSAQTHQLLL